MNNQRTLNIIGSITGFTGVILQYIALHQQFETTLIQFMSYFTILTNLMVSVYFTALLFPESRLYRLAKLPSTGSALTIYILVVGLVYQTMLRQLNTHEGLYFISDNMVHGWMPVFTLFYWYRFIYGNPVNWKDLPVWLIYPLAFLFYSLIRGHFTEWYPYPFLDVIAIGYPKVWINSAGVSALFILLSALFITITNRKHIRSSAK